MTDQEVGEALTHIRPVKGRMNILRGLEDSVIIDDTYNSSPAAAAAALQTLYELQAPQRIALLGDMRELGGSSQREHEKLGELCDPSLLAWVVTIGVESEQWLAPKARARGCQVKSFRSAIEAGKFIHSVMERDAIILAKGSQNTVFAEEAIKVFLHATEEEEQLVRQSPTWLKIKNDFFTSLS
jgi:UDP-N-acetylmuramoyl-tripeptide--D-alanyl-D-alanine ligase